MNKIGIVGGTGFIGSALATHLCRSFEIKILDIKPMPKDLEGKVEYRRCDVRRFDDVDRGLRDVELVIHAAIVQIPLINEAKRLGYEVNILGTQTVCEVVNQNSSIRGMILTGSWHVIGEKELRGVIDEAFGFRPDKVEDRARLYALCKIGQEMIVRLYDEMSEKVYGVIRTGTVLGMGMSEKTAAAIFTANGLKGKPLTPYKHSMYRPMLYVSIDDVCRAYEIFARKILNGEVTKESNSLAHIFDVYYPEPVTILELAEMVKDAIVKHSNALMKPKIEVVDTGQQSLFSQEDKWQIEVDVSKAMNILELAKLKSPRECIEEIVQARLNKAAS